MQQEKSKKMMIGQLAKKAEINLQTIRYYESLDLLPEPERTQSGYRQYDDNYLDYIVFIKNSQELGFSLEEIRKLVELKTKPQALGNDVKAIIRKKIIQVDEKIKSMQELKDYLQGLDVSCSGDMKTSDCPILKSLCGSKD